MRKALCSIAMIFALANPLYEMPDNLNSKIIELEYEKRACDGSSRNLSDEMGKLVNQLEKTAVSAEGAVNAYIDYTKARRDHRRGIIDSLDETIASIEGIMKKYGIPK